MAFEIEVYFYIMTNRTQQEIMQNWGADYFAMPLVSVHCITYNHEPYIAQALDGFLMQKTNFPFEVIVHDDASTDRTAEIIREYEARFPKIIKPIYETENQYSKHDGSLGRIMDAACKGKYIAFCEGDDYWIDGNKLQMQVDFLEGNPEYGMCYTRARQFIQKERIFSKTLFGKPVADFNDLLQNGNRIPTLTVMLRKSLHERYREEIHPENKGWLMDDYPTWLYVAHESKVKFVDSVTSVYRVLEESASHSKDFAKMVAFEVSSFSILVYFAEKYNVGDFPIKKEKERYVYKCLELRNRKVCRKIDTSGLALKFKVIKMASFSPVSFRLLGGLRKVWLFLKKTLVERMTMQKVIVKKMEGEGMKV